MKIKKGIKELLSVWKNVFGNWKYITLAAVIGLVFYSINVLIANFSLIIYFYKENGLIQMFKFFSNLFLGFKETILFSSFIILISISVLLGILFSLIAYRTIIIKNVAGEIGILATAGIFLGILVPGCAACGIGLLSLFGVSAAVLTFLPFKGLEISFLAIGILGFSIFKISKDMNKGIACEIDTPLRKNEKLKLKGGKII